MLDRVYAVFDDQEDGTRRYIGFFTDIKEANEYCKMLQGQTRDYNPWVEDCFRMSIHDNVEGKALWSVSTKNWKIRETPNYSWYVRDQHRGQEYWVDDPYCCGDIVFLWLPLGHEVYAIDRAKKIYAEWKAGKTA